MRLTPQFLLGPILLAISLPALAADEWVHLVTPHFEIFTNAGEKKGREAILYFEEVRSFVSSQTDSTWDQAVPVRIIAFRSEKQFRPYAPNGAAAAFYAATQSRDYIVMQDFDRESYPVAVHEYMHLVVRHSGLKLPTWLNEGWADVFSTLRPDGKNAIIGEVLPGRLQVLNNEKWLDFQSLTSVTQKNPVYNEKSRAGIFYAESWALTHMLYLGPTYHANFGKLIAALNAGKSAAEAVQFAYDRPPARIYADLQSYLHQGSINAGVFPAKLEKSAEEAVLLPVSVMESELVLADLLASGKPEEAKTTYEGLARQYPGNPEIAKSLGYLAWRSGDNEGARKYFEEALPGATDPQMCYHLASLYHDSTQNDKVIAALKKALSLKADYTGARMLLGVTQMNMQNFQAAIDTFSGIRKVTAEHAAGLFNALAYAYLQTGALEPARTSLQSARKWLKSDAEIQQADQLQRYIDAREAAKSPGGAARPSAPPISAEALATGRPTLRRGDGAVTPSDSAIETNPMPRERLDRAEGEFQALECAGSRATLVVLVGRETMRFVITDPNSITIRHEGANTFQFECGPQKKSHVAVDYVVDGTVTPGITGVVRRLEF